MLFIRGDFMEKQKYLLLEQYMLSCMNDSAHDKEHIYRVLYVALEIGQYEKNVNKDVLVAACLLHDIGRKEQFENPTLCHAKVGSEKAYLFLVENGWENEEALHIKDCILTHRYRADNPPKSIEAKILFDSDKIDVTGAIGIARTLIYKGKVSEPLYSLCEDGSIADGTEDKEPSFFHEYKYKLENIYDKFYTEQGRNLAKKRKLAAVNFYESIFAEVKTSYEVGINLLREEVAEN